MRMKKKVSLMAVSLLIMTAAVIPLTGISAEVQTKSGVTLSRALEHAMKENVEIRLINEQIALAEARYTEALEDVPYAKNRKSNDAMQEATNRKQELVVPLTTEADLLQLNQQKNDLLLEVRLQVESLYIRYHLLQDQLRTVRDEIENANVKYEAQKKLIETGRDIPSSIDSIEIGRLQLQQRLTELESQQELLKLDLATATGMDVRQLSSLGPAPVPAAGNLDRDVDTLSQRVKASHPSIALAQLRVDSAVKEFDIMQKAHSLDFNLLDEFKTAEDQAFTARLALRDAEAQAELKTRSDYNTILNLQDAVVIAELERDRAAKLYTMNEKRHSLGMITDLELFDARTQAEAAESALQQAKLDLYAAVERFEHYVTTSVEAHK